MARKNKKKEGEGIVVGIDLGTTRCAVALYDADGKTRLLPNLDGEFLTPSVVNLKDEKHPVVGRAAVNQAAFDVDYTVKLVKRLMGLVDSANKPVTAFVHPDSGRTYTPEEISAQIITYLLRSAETATGRKVVGVVVTVPAYFQDPARLATKRAVELAGAKCIRIINEPTAAAVAYGMDEDHDRTLLVFDFGGGTFDSTVGKFKDGKLDVLATDGDRNTGGSDIDNRTYMESAERFKAETGVEISPKRDLVVSTETLEKVIRAKEDLSTMQAVSIMLSAEGKRLRIDVTRDEFNKLITDIVDRVMDITANALKAAKLTPKDVDEVLLVGGSSRIPLVRERIEAMFRKPGRCEINPDEAVAMGAAIVAAKSAAEDDSIVPVDAEGRKVLPPAIELTDVNAHPLGCLARGKDGVPRNSVVIPANTPLPAIKADIFGLEFELQTTARVVVVQGQPDAAEEDCTAIGEVILDDLPVGPLVPRIAVEYAYSEEGILSVTATDKVSGKTTNGVIENRAGLAPQRA